MTELQRAATTLARLAPSALPDEELLAHLVSAGVHLASLERHGAGWRMVARTGGRAALVLAGLDAAPAGGSPVRVVWLERPALPLLQQFFAHAAPSTAGGAATSIGLRDPLGLATAAHARAMAGAAVHPVLVSGPHGGPFDPDGLRDAIDGAAEAAVAAGLQGGWGAHAGPLRTPAEVRSALDAGATMVTLALGPSPTPQPYDEAAARDAYERRTFEVQSEAGDTFNFRIEGEALRSLAAAWSPCVAEVVRVCREAVPSRDVDFGLSLEGCAEPTPPEAHFFLCRELASAGVKLASVAPRLPGSGLKRFEEDLRLHVAIADSFGHRLQVTAEEPEARFLPVVTCCTRLRLHLTLVGPAWLAGLEVLARRAPPLVAEVLGPDAGGGSFVALLDDPEARARLAAAARGRPDLHGRLREALAGASDEFEELVEGRLRRHLEDLGVMGAARPRREAVV